MPRSSRQRNGSAFERNLETAIDARRRKKLLGVTFEVIGKGLQRVVFGINSPNNHVKCQHESSGFLCNHAEAIVVFLHAAKDIQVGAGQQTDFSETRTKFIMQVSSDSCALRLCGMLQFGALAFANFRLQLVATFLDFSLKFFVPNQDGAEQRGKYSCEGEDALQSPPRWVCQDAK